jgi:transposase
MPVGAKRHELGDAAWRRLEPLLPRGTRMGRPPKDHRLVVDALLWLGKTGAPWRDLPERFGPWRTVATRFYRWTRIGLWERILAELRRVADAHGGIDWEVHLVDGTSVRAHRCAAGAKGGSTGRPWAARAAGSAASCTSAATAGAGRWRSC